MVSVVAIMLEKKQKNNNNTNKLGKLVGSSASIQTAKFVKENAHGQGKEVWRVQWDISGMQLASSGDDGKVRLWRKKLQGLQFENFETIDSNFVPTREEEE